MVECPICFEAYSRENPARGPEECMPAACQHSICQQCCVRIVDGAWHPFKCPICRRNNSSWFTREFVFRNEPLTDPEPEESDHDLPKMLALRNRLVATLNEMYPDLNRNWQRDLPTDMGLLEVILDDFSLVFGMR